MVTVVATWNERTGEGKIHLALDSSLYERDTRLKTAEEKVLHLEQLFAEEPVEVVLAHARTLEDFRRSDPRFYEA